MNLSNIKEKENIQEKNKKILFDLNNNKYEEQTNNLNNYNINLVSPELIVDIDNRLKKPENANFINIPEDLNLNLEKNNPEKLDFNRAINSINKSVFDISTDNNDLFSRNLFKDNNNNKKSKFYLINSQSEKNANNNHSTNFVSNSNYLINISKSSNETKYIFNDKGMIKSDAFLFNTESLKELKESKIKDNIKNKNNTNINKENNIQITKEQQIKKEEEKDNKNIKDKESLKKIIRNDNKDDKLKEKEIEVPVHSVKTVIKKTTEENNNINK